LLTLDELKVQLRIATGDTSRDAELILIINGVSAQIASMVNRVFGYEKVRETFYDVQGRKLLYFSRWPVLKSDIVSMTLDGVDILTSTDWVLEEKTGTLYTPPSKGRVCWNGDLDIIYSGGYKIPEEAPDDLKKCCSVAAREDYYTYVRGTVLSGVRMISHKSARVMYYPPGQVSTTGGGGGAQAQYGPTWQAIQNVLRKYFRHWV